jgi:hypothetical protein
MSGKTCTKCKVHKPFSDFPKDKHLKDGHNLWCRTCYVDNARLWTLKNQDSSLAKKQERKDKKEEALRLRMEEYSKICTKCSLLKSLNDFPRDKRLSDGRATQCSVCVNAAIREIAKRNPEKAKARCKRWRDENPEKNRAAERIRSHRKISTPKGALSDRMSSGIYNALKQKKNGYKWESLVGYTTDDLKQHIEKHFYDDMSWDNRDKWHIDHIIPKSVFNYETAEDLDFKRCWALENLRPMWMVDNIRKYNHLENHFQPSLLMGG